MDQESVDLRLRRRTDCRSWVVACEDTLTSLRRSVTAAALRAAVWALRPTFLTDTPSFARRAPAHSLG
ncbi:MAG TPA: hypothetical protein VK478_15985 [Gemmatimonadaceae bacterium]|nr:hypothetical protein [Gemmatimonadaceae bacterium]